MQLLPINQLSPLLWDSQMMGFGVARVLLNDLAPLALAELLAAARHQGLALLYLVASPVDARSNASARQAGAWLADRKATFVMPVAAGLAQTPAAAAVTVEPTTEWTARLEDLALQSGAYSRFRRDPRLPSSVFVGIYREWLRKSLSGELARQVLVGYASAGPGGPKQPDGLLTLGSQHGRADVGLLAVAAEARGQGIGQRLVQAAQRQAALWKFDELQVVTQLENVLACRFYRRCGFVESVVEHVYHLWL